MAKFLAEHTKAKVVGMDNFNEYYDVALKYKRADLLSHWNTVQVLDGDVCDAPFLRSILEDHHVTHVLHLAAQAGVRYSLEQPLSYVRNNIQCFVTLLEELRRLKGSSNDSVLPRFVYASSSSVYGGNVEIPFKETDEVDNPSSVYGFSKRANELLALVYFKVFGIPSVGLRFFTVYGPWGRPDMAPYKFTASISKGENITVYNQGDMARDFTYIDDIVSGIYASLSYLPSSSEVINLGKSKPEQVLDLVKIIEKEVGRTARLSYEDSAVDLHATYASTSKAKELLSYAPQVSMDEGIKRFVEWYFLYTGERALCASECSEMSRCIPSPFDDMLTQSVEATHGCQTVIYTAFFGPTRSGLQDPPAELACNDERCCAVAFTNIEIPMSASRYKWKIIMWSGENFHFWDNRRLSRVMKLSPARFFSSSVEHAIYIDTKLTLKADYNYLVGMLSDNENRTASLVAVRHPARNGPFEEKEAITGHKKTRSSVTYTLRTLDHQVNGYLDLQNTQNISMVNMIEGALLVHKLKNKSGRKFRCAWSKEYYGGCDRDQISFTAVLAKEAHDAGSNLDPDQEWCKVSSDPDSYVRILPRILHWSKGSLAVASEKDAYDRKLA